MATLLATIDPGDEVIVFEPFYENYGPDAIVSGATPGSSGCASPTGASTRTNWRQPSRTARAPSSSTRRTTRPAKCSRARNWASSRGSVSSGTSGRHRRDLRAHRLRRPPARAAGHAGWHGRSHRDDQRVVEDLQRHGVAHRVGHRASGAVRRDPQDARLHHRRRARAAPGGRGGGPGARRQLLPAARLRLRASARPAPRHPRSTRLRDVSPGRRVLHHDGHRALRLSRRRRVCRHLVADIGVAAVPGSSFYRDQASGRTKLRFCFAKRDETMAEADRRLARLAVAG